MPDETRDELAARAALVGRSLQEYQLLATDDLAAPHLMPVEVANGLRRATMSGEIRPTLPRLRMRTC